MYCGGKGSKVPEKLKPRLPPDGSKSIITPMRRQVSEIYKA